VRNYFHDTHVLLQGPYPRLSFADSRVLIPTEVIAEFKRESTEPGQKAHTGLHHEFHRLVVVRPPWMGVRDSDFLPGSLGEKLAPWRQPIRDAFQMLSDLGMGHDHCRGHRIEEGRVV
jgi:predicted ribonuclease YlaK